MLSEHKRLVIWIFPDELNETANIPSSKSAFGLVSGTSIGAQVAIFFICSIGNSEPEMETDRAHNEVLVGEGNPMRDTGHTERFCSSIRIMVVF